MQHYNTSISEDAHRILNLKSGDSNNEISDEIQTVILIERMTDIVREVNQATTGTITVFTTPSDKDFYLCSVQASYSKNAACDVATGKLSVFGQPEGDRTSGRDFLAFAVQTLTAEQDTEHIVFNKPIKIRKGTQIQMTGSFTAGAMARVVIITGYTMETYKGV